MLVNHYLSPSWPEILVIVELNVIFNFITVSFSVLNNWFKDFWLSIHFPLYLTFNRIFSTISYDSNFYFWIWQFRFLLFFYLKFHKELTDVSNQQTQAIAKYTHSLNARNSDSSANHAQKAIYEIIFCVPFKCNVVTNWSELKKQIYVIRRWQSIRKGSRYEIIMNNLLLLQPLF